jgi:predicted TIM-barrel fold metal-dependent hydrolase
MQAREAVMLIDIHTHIYTRPYLEALSRRTEIPRVDIKDDGEHLMIFRNEAEALGGTRPMSTAFFRPEDKLEFMATAGIDLSIVSLGNPWLDFFTAEESADWARAINDEIIALAEKNSRFQGLGVLPMQNPAAAVTEIDYVAGQEYLHGVVIGTRPAGGHLDQPELEPVWAALERAGVPAFLHPHYCVGYDWMMGYGHALPLALAFPFETSVAAVRLVLSGLLERYPNLEIILAHGGGTLPYLTGRLEKCVSVDPVARRSITRPAVEYLRMFYYDAVTYSADALRCAIALAGTDRIMFGTDHPFGVADEAQNLTAIETACSDHGEREAIRCGNASRWIETGRLRRHGPRRPFDRPG